MPAELRYVIHFPTKSSATTAKDLRLRAFCADIGDAEERHWNMADIAFHTT
jgi:hypothetical protein